MNPRKNRRPRFDVVQSFDVIGLFLIIVIANTHLILGNFSAKLIFLPDAFLSGDWWRLFTFPFVHTGWYHLFLDAGAFLFLYTDLPEKRAAGRFLCVGISSLFSLAAVWLTSPEIHLLGLNGLSGIGHGLMAFSTLQMALTPENRRIGAAAFGLLVAKSLYELLTGDVLFHFGLCGTPMPASHAGGILGGIFLFTLQARKP